MKAARACGIETAGVTLIDAPMPILSVERFDRKASVKDGMLRVECLHQKDLAQAFGRGSALKYVELEGGSMRAVADLIRDHSSRPARDIQHLARLLCFSCLIGNCDAHLKNYALLYRDDGARLSPVLAPAYDLVCTTLYPKFSRELAMDYGATRLIDDITPDTFLNVARDLGMTATALKRIAGPIAEGALVAIDQAGEGAMGPVFASTPYIAEDLIEDMAPRREVLLHLCNS